MDGNAMPGKKWKQRSAINVMARLSPKPCSVKNVFQGKTRGFLRGRLSAKPLGSRDRLKPFGPLPMQSFLCSFGFQA